MTASLTQKGRPWISLFVSRAIKIHLVNMNAANILINVIFSFEEKYILTIAAPIRVKIRQRLTKAS